MEKQMKTAIFLIILAGLLQTTVAQTRVFTNFNSVHSGRSINVLASAQVKGRHEFGGGFRININKYAHNDDQNNIFKKRMFATKPIHYFGVEGFYNVHIFQKLKHIDLFAFYNVQVVYSTTRNRAFIPAFEHEGETYYTKHECTYGPFTWIEQNIGIGFTVDIWNNIFLSQRLGAGVCFILGKDYPNENKPYFLAKPPFSWEFGYLLSVGFGYRFEKKK